MMNNKLVPGLALLVWIAGCTGSNPFYDAGEIEEDDGADGIVPDVPGEDGSRDDAVREDNGTTEDVAGEVDEDAPGEVDEDAPVEVEGDGPEEVVDIPVEAEAGVCGDGTVNTGEECDDGGLNSDTAPDACRTNCTNPHCGDDVMDTGETCDDGAANSDTVPDACRTSCLLASCGDNVVDTGETCDNGAANSDTAPDACRTTCLPAFCGDGVVDTGETCDSGAANSDTTPDACRTSCLPASCGDAVVDTGEECENSSSFCAACVLTAPAGWLRCTDAAGNVAIFRVETWAGNHTADAFRDHCVALVEAESPVDYAYYGLGVFYDRSLWDCVLPSLVGGTSYWCGLAQDTGAADYVEPDHGWYWRGYDGTGWIDAAPFDPANGFITGDFNNAGGGPNVECTRLTSGMFGWTASDYSCTTAAAYSGICMIRF